MENESLASTTRKKGLNGLHGYIHIPNPDAIPEEAFAPPALSELPNPRNNTENLPLSLLSQNNSNASIELKTELQMHDFLPTPKLKVVANAPRKKSLNYRAQEVTKIGLVTVLQIPHNRLL
ncbi:unnamed protein product [Arctia plantaginis]|uniref:Uncharacterized protein n=1 Tax=Arctia plantaginis TaxID=874455 RepID=A0A8S0Z2C7_ARCPL|nr:unnamed protein product [Arctia plantaginis]